jgi:hypothetical protein
MPSQSDAVQSDDSWRRPAPAGSHRGYLGAGVFHLPVDGGYTAAALVGGRRLGSQATVVHMGGRLLFGDSPHSSVVGGLADVQISHWWGSGFALGTGVAFGAMMASEKSASGWDGARAGMLVSATVKQRWGRLEPALEIGVLKAFGEDYPAPFALLWLLYRL